MHNMKKIGSAVRMLRKSKGITLEDLANRVGYDQGNLSKFERGLQATDDSMVERLAKELEKTVPDLLRLAAELEEAEGLSSSTGADSPLYASQPIKLYTEVKEVPVYEGEHLQALAEDRANLDAIEVKERLPAPPNAQSGDFALLVSDDSMTAPAGAPTSYPKGSYVYFARGLEHQSGDAVLVLIGDTKRTAFTSLQQVNGTWTMVPLNPRYQPKELPFNSKILAVAYGVYAVTRSR